VPVGSIRFSVWILLNYNHLHYFHVAAIEGSVAAAAVKLDVTQPTVSEQLRALERGLGATLFERTRDGLKLTEAGRLVFDQTSVMFRAAERLVESLGHGPAPVPRTLRVGISGTIARATTTDFLMPLLRLEGCIPTIRTGDTLELIRDLHSNDVDLVLCEGEPPDAIRRTLEIVAVAKTPLVAIAPPAVVPSSDWRDTGLVQYRMSSTLRWEVESFLDDRGLRPQIMAEADDSLFLVEASARGGYIAIVPKSVARDALLAGRVRVLAQLEGSHAGVYALYRDGATAELARRAIAVLVQHARALQESLT
jgi:LysR family transcriptional activator of nhaA